eukprot:symbB.v1.2.014934.t1/scaffold1103.1/size137753/10
MGTSSSAYAPLHPQLAEQPLSELLSPELRAALAEKDPKAAIRSLAQRHLVDAFSLPLLCPKFCHQLMEEVKHFRKSKEDTGDISPGPLLSSRWYLYQINPGFKILFNQLLQDVLRTVDNALIGESHDLAYHEAYCINYEEGRDRSLKAHTDDSDLTVNVFLGIPGFEGAELLLLDPTPEDVQTGTPRLGDLYKGSITEYQHHAVGTAVLHPGDRWHAVQQLKSGSRWNLIIMAMRNDKEWKRTFYDEMTAQLQEKAQILTQGT